MEVNSRTFHCRVASSAFIFYASHEIAAFLLYLYSSNHDSIDVGKLVLDRIDGRAHDPFGLPRAHLLRFSDHLGRAS